MHNVTKHKNTLEFTKGTSSMLAIGTGNNSQVKQNERQSVIIDGLPKVWVAKTTQRLWLC
jgi:hypothetical protein